jgi:hypothetical protein
LSKKSALVSDFVKKNGTYKEIHKQQQYKIPAVEKNISSTTGP